jgi:hypothetical protein
VVSYGQEIEIPHLLRICIIIAMPVMNLKHQQVGETMNTRTCKFANTAFISLQVIIVLSLFTPAKAEVPIGSADLAGELSSYLAQHDKVAIIALSRRQVVASGRAFDLVEGTATILRSKGYRVFTLSQPEVALAVGRATTASGSLTSPSSSNLVSSLGLAALMLVSLSGAEGNRLSVSYSINAPGEGVLHEIHKSRLTLASLTPQAQSSSGNLLKNGGFEADWTTDWTRKYGDIQKGASVTEVVEGAKGNILHMKHTGLSHVQLYQVVDVPEGEIWFHFQGKFHTWEGPIIGFSGTGTAGITLMFIRGDGKLL